MPTKAIASNGQNDVPNANARPVAAINTAAPSSRRRLWKRWPHAPTASVAIADPSSVALASRPTSQVPKPSASR